MNDLKMRIELELFKFSLFELIATFYKKEGADGIMINNALDHCIDPFKAIVECL